MNRLHTLSHSNLPTLFPIQTNPPLPLTIFNNLEWCMLTKMKSIGNHDRSFFDRRENSIFDIQDLLWEKIEIDIIGLTKICSGKI